MPNALFTFVTGTSKENRYRATSGNINSCTESFASLTATREGFVCLFVLNINHPWQSGHGYLKPVSGCKGARVSITQPEC